MMHYDELLGQALERDITPEEALFLFEETNDMGRFIDLLKCASQVRDKQKGNEFKLWCHLPSMTKGCITKPPCRYCGVAPAAHKKNAPPPAKPEQLAAMAKMAERLGFEGVQPGGGCTGLMGSDAYDDAKVIKDATGLKVYSNYGYDMSEENIIRLKEIGIDRIGAQLEFVHPEMFYKIKPGDNLDGRKKVLALLEKHNVGLDSGLMIGVGESLQDRVDGIFYLKGFKNLVRTSICGFKPMPGTPMQKQMPATSMDIATTLAIMRLALRDVDIEGTFGRDDQLQLWIAAGTNMRLIHGSFRRASQNGHGPRPFFKAETTPVADDYEYVDLLPFYLRMIEEAGMKANLKPLAQ
jgi:biotin synthase